MQKQNLMFLQKPMVLMPLKRKGRSKRRKVITIAYLIFGSMVLRDMLG
jgi:hypothetical protein